MIRFLLFVMLSNIVTVNHLIAQTKTVTLNTALTGNKTYIAREGIFLNPGFSYTAGPGESFIALIDESLVLDADYLSTSINPVGRQLNTSAPVSTNQGIAGVSPTGAATYQFPIYTPPGIAGIEPNISITYNSQGGSGLLGEGWDITGLSAITRVPKNIYQDGVADGINFSLEDRYALDGNRLLAPDDIYGAENTTYETEVKTFSKIESFGVINDVYLFVLKIKTGPAWFRVTTKEGKIIEYGNTDDSKIVPIEKNAPIAWLVNKISDANGNYMTFSYKKLNGEVAIERIDYTANGSKKAMNSIQFFYDKKSEANFRYINSRKIGNALLLRKIKIITNDVAVRTYEFDYFIKNNHTFLNQITEIGPDNIAFNSTIIGWGNDNTTIIPSSLNVSGAPSNYKNLYWFSDDINNDGISDLICLDPKNRTTQHLEILAPSNTIDYDADTVYLMKVSIFLGNISNGNLSFTFYKSYSGIPSNTLLGYFSTSGNIFSSAKPHYSLSGSPFSGHFSGNNEKDIIIPVLVDNTLFKDYSMVFYINGEPSESYFTSSGNMPLFTIDDFNNDGKDELFLLEVDKYNGKYTSRLYLKNSNNQFDHNFYYIDLESKPKQIISGDFNNDGTKDILIVCENGYKFYENQNISKNNKGSFFPNFSSGSYSTLFNGNYSFIKPGDFNGDGLLDLILNEHCNNKWYIAFNNGNWNFYLYSLPNITAVEESFTDKNNDKDQCIVTDFNHDGRSDVIIIDAVYNKETNFWGQEWGTYQRTDIKWYCSNGTGFDLLKSLSTTIDDYSFNKLIVQGDFNGDGREDILNIGSDLYASTIKDNLFRIYATFNNNYEGGMVKTISDGLGYNTTFTYQPLTKTSTSTGETFYTKGVDAVYPVRNIQGPIYCVASITTPDGIGGVITTKYSYENARVHLTGKGFLGFTKITSSNNIANRKIITTTQLDETCWLPLKQTIEEKTIDNEQISKIENNYTNTKQGNSYFSALSSTIANDFLKGNTTTTSYSYTSDGLGNLQTVTIDYGGGFRQTTTYGDWIQAGSFIKNKPQIISIASKHPDDVNTFSNTTRYTYNTTTGNLTKEERNYMNYGPNDKLITITYSNFDQWGHPLSIITSATSDGGNINQSQTFTYDITGRFITSVTDGLGTTSSTYDATYGTLINVKSVNGLTTEYQYNNLGRLVRTLLPDGNIINQSINWVTGNDVPNALYYIQTERSGRAYSRTYYDKLGRVVREETLGFGGVKIYTDHIYNNTGQLSEIVSYMGSIQINHVTYSYDKFGRLSSENYSTGRTVSYSYNNNVVSITDNGKTTTYTYDKWGLLQSVSEPSPGGTINYKYCSNGKPKSIQSPTSLVSMTYDAVGYQRTLTDPNAGTYEYKYDAIGRLTYQKTPTNNITNIYYDNLGRIDYKTDKNGNITYDYEYYTSGIGIGKLQKVSASNGSWDSYEYDTQGRLYKTTRHIDATINDLIFQYNFDNFGNVSKITYPGGYEVQQQYDRYGNLIKVLNGTTVIWQLDELTALKMKYTLGNGQVTEKTFDSNGLLSSIVTSKGATQVQNLYYTYDAAKGLMTTREDRRSGYNLKENFIYDNLDRLNTWMIYKNSTLTGSYSIAYRNDRIFSKSDVGNYFYDNSSSGAVSRVVTPGIIGYTPNEQTINYSANDKVSQIIESGNQLNIMYGPDEQRIKSELSIANSIARTSYYDGLYEAIKETGKSMKEYYYIAAGDGLVAVVIKQDNNYTPYYIHRDHLGSIVCLTNASGAIQEQMSYDPWGRRRNPQNWGFDNVPLPTILSRGFTGHEHLDDFALINMNGRVYDPILGMFLSPDNYVQAPTHSQSFNRYSYCLGNPLIYTDPSGEIVWFVPVIIGAVIGAYTGGVIANKGQYNPGKWDYSSGKTWGYMLGGAVVGGVSGYVGWAIAGSGIPMANTAAIAGASFTNSVGTYMYTGGQTPITMSFGVASYDFTNGEFGYLGKKGNSVLENIGYGFGALANLSDMVSLLKGGGQNIKVNSAKITKDDWWGHSSITDGNDNALVSVGPDSPVQKAESLLDTWQNSIKRAKLWDTYLGENGTWSVELNNVSTTAISNYASGITRWDLLFNSCVGHTTRALWSAGIPTIYAFHPHMLNLQLLIRQIGIYSSPYLYQIP